LGNGSQTKSYISVEDVIDGIVTVLHEQSTAYDVYNIATEDFLTVTQIANIAIEILGLTNVEINYGKSDKGWKADVPQILLDTSKLRKLGWMNKLTSEEAMRNSIISMK
jgi:UDP-glucose 4-epimerase